MEDPDNVGMMMASTPSGKRGFFYRNSVEETFNLDDKVQPVNTKELGYIYDTSQYTREAAEGFKEFHFPSNVSPHWNERMEREMKSQFNSVEYEHEVLAEFGIEMQGVFSKEFIDEAASKSYQLKNYPEINAPIAIGVDYDKYGAQSNIIVLQYDPHDQRRVRTEMGDTKQETGYGRFKVINRIEIPKADNHYDLTVRRIIELNKVYNPFIIVPDAGAGEYQNEMLRKEIGDKVKPVFYGGRIDVRDPISRQIESKPIKPWLVNQTNLLLERGQLRIPHIEIDETLSRQMMNFRVTKVTERGIPKYTSSDEHSLDAMIFALYGFMEEMPELVNILDKMEPARSIQLVKTSQRDSIRDKITEVIEDKSSSNELITHSSRAKPGITRRGTRSSRNTNQLSWGRRGRASARPKGRRF